MTFRATNIGIIGIVGIVLRDKLIVLENDLKTCR